MADDAAGGISRRSGLFRSAGGLIGTSLIAGFTGVAVAGAVAGFVKGGIDELSNLQAEAAKTEAIIKATGGVANVTAGDVQKLAQSLSRVSGEDDILIQRGLNVLATFKAVRNEAGAGNDIFNRSAAAALDLSKIFGGVEQSSIQLGKALANPIKGVGALARAGVDFTDQQKAQIKALVESGNLLGAQKIILGEVESQVGGVAEAVGKTLPGQLGRMREAFEDAQVAVAQALLPAFTAIAPVLSDLAQQLGPVLGEVFEALAPVLGDLGKAAILLLQALLPLLPPITQLVAAFLPLIPVLTEMVTLMVSGLVPILTPLISGLASLIKALVGNRVALFAVKVALAILLGPIAVVGLAVQTLGGTISTVWEAIKRATLAVWNTVRTVVVGAVNVVRSAVSGAFNAIRSIVVGVWNAITSATRTAWNTITGIVRSAINALMAPIRAFRRALDFILPGSLPPLAKGILQSHNALRDLDAAFRSFTPNLRALSGAPLPAGVGAPISVVVNEVAGSPEATARAVAERLGRAVLR